METTNIVIIKGDTFDFMVKFTDLESEITGMHFTCKKNPTDVATIFEKTLSSGITKIEDGLYKVRVAPADTRNVEAGWYNYDFEVDIGQDIYTVLIGRLRIVQDITN